MLPLHVLREPDSGYVHDGALVVSAHIRVRNGRRFCPEALGAGRSRHVLKPADPDVVYARFRGNWWCDACCRVREVICRECGPTMYHCTAGCEYDLCASCMMVMMF